MAFDEFLAALLAPASSGGPSTGLGAPIPQTRWGDTIGSVNSTSGGPVRRVPGMGGPVPSPGMGYGAPMPRMAEDRSFVAPMISRNLDGFESRQIDPVAQLMAAWLNRRFPNEGERPAWTHPPGWDMPPPGVVGSQSRENPGYAAIEGQDSDPARALFALWLTSRFLPRKSY